MIEHLAPDAPPPDPDPRFVHQGPDPDPGFVVPSPDPYRTLPFPEPTTLESAPPGPRPRTVPLPLGGNALMYTRENLTQLYRCGHGELGRLLARKMAPLPIRIEGQILWYVDEVLAAQAQVIRTLQRWRR